MALFEEFEVTLKEVVQAKRLSASKMGKLTEIALKSMEYDTQMVSILYRTHKSLPPASKVSSLYVFDALARAAKHQADKQETSAESLNRSGNVVTFLSKVGAVVEGLFQDMLNTGNPDAKEKTKKILDIWVKGNTFPAEILSRLSGVLKPTEKAPSLETHVVTIPNPEPAVSEYPANVVTPPNAVQNPPTLDPQATLLALLTQAANTAGSSTSSQTNVNTAAPHLAAAQLALLQQLTQSASVVPVQDLTPRFSAPAQSVQQFSPAAVANLNSRSPRQSRPDDPRKQSQIHTEIRHGRLHSPENGRPYDSQFDDRSYTSARGNTRGSIAGRGRGWGDRRRWDDRGRDRYIDRERDQSPRSLGGRRSRSRSPPSRYGNRQIGKPYSPRRQSPLATQRHGDRNAGINHDSGKDEFGRDIRPQIPEDGPSSVTSQNPLPSEIESIPVDEMDLEPSTSVGNKLDAENLTPVIAPITSSNKPSAPFVSNTVSSHQGMESFDVASFDLRSPASWEALGKMWQVTHGYAPTTEQLMQFVMSTGTTQSDVNQDIGQMRDSAVMGQTWGRGRDLRGFGQRGRGGFVHGKPRNGQQEQNHDDCTRETDAILLGGGSDSVDLQYSDKVNGYSSVVGDSDTGRGKMQKVGDKWVFVRGSAGTGP